MEIPASSAPVEYDYELFPTEQYLYLAIGTNTLKRFDGTNMVTLPYFEFPNGITKIESIPGTDEIFILAWNSQILHFDGSNISEIYREPDIRYLLFMTFMAWENKLFFTMAYRDKIFYYDGTSVNEFLLPDGAKFAYFANLIVYRDSLLIPAKLPDESKVLYAYNGSSFSRIFDFPDGLDAPKAFLREGNYVIIPKMQGSEAFEYNGTIFSRIYAPDEKNIRRYLTSTSCFHLWSLLDYEEHEREIAIENKDCESSTSSVAIIPERLRDYSRIEFWVNGRYRDWCWTDLYWDYSVNPICPVPEICPDPIFEASLTNQQGETFWEKQFEKPFEIRFPFEDKEPYTLTLSSVVKDRSESLFILNDDLMANGLADIHITMLPQNDYFLLAAETDKGEKVPFMLSLLNKKGETIWKDEFIAPMKKEIAASVKEPGTTLQFSSISKGNNDLKKHGINQVSVFPNLFKGKLTVEIESLEEKVPVEITITDLTGQVVWKDKVVAPVSQNIEMVNQKPGVYVLTLRIGDDKISEQIKLEF